MRYLYLVLSFLFASVSDTFSQNTFTGSFVHDGETRTYSYYIPASYVPGTPVPLVMGLHGTSSSGTEFAQYRDFKPIADTANFIVVNPDGTTMLGIRFWNYGNVFGSTVDDVGFLEALIDTISAHYSINPNRVYCTGMSNGSFMAYRMACDTYRFAAIAGVTGSMSVDMYNNCNPSHSVPTLHIHGTDDNINPYDGTSSMIGIDELTRFWVDENVCDTTPATFIIPDINTTDNSTATRYLYTGGEYDHTVELFKVQGGGHSWPGGPMPGSGEVTCMDFNASAEIWRFFSQYERSGISSDENWSQPEIHIWPNPATGPVNLQIASHTVQKVTVYDLNGKKMLQVAGGNVQSVDLTGLVRGIYIAHISGNGFSMVRKLTLID